MSGFNYIDENQVRRAEGYEYTNPREDNFKEEKIVPRMAEIPGNKEEDFEIKYYWIRTL